MLTIGESSKDKLNHNRMLLMYVVDGMYTENVNMPAANLEWVMTDQCGLASVSVTPNVPPMVLDTGASFGAANMPQVSRYQGNAVYFNGGGYVGAHSKPSAMFNVTINNGFTMFVWLYANSAATQFPFGEIAYDTGSAYIEGGLTFWLDANNLHYNGEPVSPLYHYYITIMSTRTCI
jgi:hypothetical protein